jgi:glycosyltransferase 2 family protein
MDQPLIGMVIIVLVAALFMDNVRPYLLSICILIAIFAALFVIVEYWMKKGGQAKDQGRKQHFGRFQAILYKGKNAIEKTGKAAADYRNESLKWWLLVGTLSVLFQVGMAWINDLLFLGFGLDIPLFELMVLITLISIITMLPISVNGIGVREASYLFFFKELGVPAEMAISVSLLFFVLVSISSLFGGLFWLTERRQAEPAPAL